MSGTDDHCEHGNLADDETWTAILERGCSGDPNCAQTFAELLRALKQAADSGPEGVRRASETLLDGIKFAYLYTDAHRLALNLYLLSLEGNLKPQDEPMQLLTAAIERGREETERARIHGEPREEQKVKQISKSHRGARLHRRNGSPRVRRELNE